MENNSEGDLREERRKRIMALLARYPGLDSDELADLLRWFRKEASARDAGLIASDPKLARPYADLKQEHLDRVNGADMFWVAMLVGGGVIALALLVWSIL